MIFGNRGSAMAMVIVLTTLLSTLGIVMISLGLTHYKVGMQERKAKLSFYLAESGLEQAYKIMMEEVAEAVKAGNEAINTTITNTLQEEARRKHMGEDYTTDYVNSYFFDGEKYVIIEVDWEKIKNNIENNQWKSDLGTFNLKTVFENAYRNSFNRKQGSKYLLLVRLEDPNEYVSPDGQEDNKPAIKVVSPPSPLFASSAKQTSLILSSSYGLSGGDKIPQKVQMTFTIKMPSEKEILKENYYYVYQDIIETNRNSELWKNVLVAYGDIQIQAADVKINGKAFAQGTNEGGFVLCGDGGVVEVNDVLASANNIKIALGAKNKNLNINENVYANNLVIDHETVDNEIKIKGDVYTKDDLVLNGEKARLKIQGNYYGFSDGSVGTTHDQSSGIIINAADISQVGGSELSISGPEMFVNGVSYIDVYDFEGNPYPTGESVSIKGNYRVYGHYLPDNTYDYLFGYYSPLTLVEERINKSTGISEKMNVFRKAEYFEGFGGQSEVPAWLSKGVNIVLPPITKIYSTGAIIKDGDIYKSGSLYTYGNAQTKVTNYQNEYNQHLLDNYSQYVQTKKNKDQSTASDVVCFSKDKDVYLIGPGGSTSVPSGALCKNVNTKVNGIVVTDRNVYLRGKLNFEGLIVAQGNIIIEDSQEKIFRDNEHYIFEKINREVAEADDPFIYSDEYIQHTIESSLEVTEPTNIIAFKQYISIDNWEKL